MIEVWSSSNEYAKPLAKVKKPTLIARGDEIAICTRDMEIEIDASTITDLVVKALKENVIFDNQLERRIAHALDLKYHGEE